ncbi:MAG: S8 family serine peptidase [Chitinophagaceae bacterium]
MRRFIPKEFIANIFIPETVANKRNRFNCSLAGEGLFYLFLIFLVPLSATAQHRVYNSKIDPMFQFMLNHSKQMNDQQLLQENFPRFQVQATEGFISKNKPPEKRYECIVYTVNAKALVDNGIVLNSVLPTIVTAWVTSEQIVQMSLMPQVKYIESPKTNYLHNDVAVGSSGASLLHQGKLNNTVYKGKNVIVGIYDTGIDWDHFDFRDPVDTTKSRILRIWDQTITAGTSEAPPSGFSYGVEYTQNQINNEIDDTPADVIRERDINGHGTHVAGTAAGNGSALPSKRYTGMAPEADIVVIKGGNSSFSEGRMIDGLTYLKNLATTLGKPAVLNWSIGGQGGAHDGTRPYEMAVDNFTTSAPGRGVVISAGNDNGINIHRSLSLASSGGLASITINVPDTTAADVFEYTMYANDNSDISFAITTPGGLAIIANAGEDVNFPVLDSSFSVSMTNRIDPANNNRMVAVYVFRNVGYTKKPTGTWTLTLVNNSTNTLTMHGWLDYRNSAFSATSLVGGNSDYLVSSPGNATTAITAASYTAKNNWYSNVVPGAYTYPAVRQDSISSFSSRGPRRDGILKPELAAHGQVVISSLSSDAAAGFSPAFITEANKYVVEQGTSMAAPGITGAVALMFQANPNAYMTQVKGYLTSTANKDVMTELNGATPNATWGYGKLDVFKAASLLFGCGPAEHRTYKYDSSTINAQEFGTSFTTQRVALMFTPDINGKLGGVFFHPSTTLTTLFIEVRTNVGGTPGVLLGTLNVDSGRISRYAFNYIDLSILNISITSGTDYFIVIARAASSISSWSLRGETLSIDGRSFLSLNAGVNWSAAGIDYKIRPVVYNNGQMPGNIASINSADIRSINTSNQFINSNCELITEVVTGGINPVNGIVTGRVWIEGSVPQYADRPYVQRHYEITPPSGQEASTARVTLYFKQVEFDMFNSNPGSTFNLPTGPTDAIGKANLRISKFSGSSSDNTGLPNTYTGSITLIDPADGDITWNAETSRWEISFDITGLSGMIVQASTGVLPVISEYFKGNTQGTVNNLTWKVSCSAGSASFYVERSDDGINFTSIGTVAAAQNSCALPFNFKDGNPMTGQNYYRIKIKETSGDVVYTNILLLQNDNPLITRLYPTVISRGATVQVNFGAMKGKLYVNDAFGRQILTRDLFNGAQTVNLGLQGKGVYFYSIKNEKTVLSKGKLIVE